METVPKFEANELVDVAIRAARIRAVDDQGVLYIGDNDELLIDPAAPNITVTRVAPKEWPPRAGDIWVDRSKAKWMASGGSVSGVVALISAHDRNGHWADPAELAAEVGPMTLAYRDGWTPTPEAPADEPAEVDRRAAYISGLRAVVDLIQSHPEISLRDYYTTLLFNQETDSDVDLWAAALGTEAATNIRRTDGLPEYEAKADLGGGIVVHAYRIGRTAVLGDDVDDPADTGARTGCECSDCEDIEAGQLDAADADQTAADAEKVLAAVAINNLSENVKQAVTTEPEPAAEVTA